MLRIILNACVMCVGIWLQTNGCLQYSHVTTGYFHVAKLYANREVFLLNYSVNLYPLLLACIKVSEHVNLTSQLCLLLRKFDIRNMLST